MFYLYHKTAYDPLIEVFQNDPRYDVALSLTDENKRVFGLFTKKISHQFLKEFEAQGYRISDEREQFDIVIVPDVVNESDYGKTLLCLVYHGVTFTKTVTFRELRKHKDSKYMIFAEGDFSVEQLKKSGSLLHSEVFKVGYPKMDAYFNNKNIKRDDILSSLGLDPEKKTVLFAPTYKPTCAYELKDAIFEATKNYNLIIKLHHYAWRGKYARHSQHKIFERRLSRYPHAVIIPPDQYSIMPLMTAADTLVSEASGAVTEFLATGKIGVIFDLNHDLFRHSDGEPLLTIDNREYLKGAFVHISHPNELRGGIERALNPSKDLIETAKQYRDYYFYKLDGKASERVKKEIERLYSEGTHFNLP